MMMKMGYKCGSGLGKNEQGITKPIDLKYQLGQAGLGNNVAMETWDSSLEDINIKENLEWLENTTNQKFTYEELLNCIKMGCPIQDIGDETGYVNPKLLQAILDGKEIFNELDQIALSKARTRANPFETIKNVFFMNRAALKMANIDAATDFMFSNVDYDPKHKDPYSPYYFADVCAGPGGFTEYILWRKKWCFKGFGFTLKGQHDFKLHESTCIAPYTFQAYYGATGDGNICNLQNIIDFKHKILHQTKGLGVHFMMADGGFSVEGNENLQEVLSKQLYVCQCLMALEIVRPGGHFVTKLFDLYTNFSVGLLYLVHQCFEQVAILKPNSSRPANSERYLIGKYLKSNITTTAIRKYLFKIAADLWTIKEQKNLSIDIEEIVPETTLKNDITFYNYICKSNNIIGEKQRIALLKLAVFCRNSSLLELRQDELRNQSLQFWRIPNKRRSPNQKFTIDDLLQSSISKPQFMLVTPREITTHNDLIKTVTVIDEWHFAPLASSHRNNYCHFYAGVTQSKVYKLQNNKWIKVKNIRLNRGTLIYAELVKEKCVSNQTGEEYEHLSLHVIDALRLENTSLADIPFRERLVCIKTYCEALNFEGSQFNIRIRPKIISTLRNISNSIVCNRVTCDYSALLEILGFNCNKENFAVHSILLMKTGDHYSFDSTYVLRAQVYISQQANDENRTLVVPLDEICEYVQNCRYN